MVLPPRRPRPRQRRHASPSTGTPRSASNRCRRASPASPTAAGGYSVRLAGGAHAARRRRGHRAGAHRLGAGRRAPPPGPISPPGTAGSTRHPATPPTSTIPPSRPGQDVIVSGMGLAFVDLLVLLMEGRGGRFEETSDGGLRYLPSGAEPRLWAGSRRGVPYHSKISVGPARRAGRGAAVLHRRRRRARSWREHGELDFRTPALAADRQGRRLRLLPGAVHRQPGTGRAWAGTNLPAGSAALDWYSSARHELVAAAVPDAGAAPGPRAAGPALRRAAASPATTTSRRRWPRYIEHDLELRTGPDHPETLALFMALLKVYMELGRIVPPERLNARSQQDGARLVARLLQLRGFRPAAPPAAGDAGAPPRRAAALPGTGTCGRRRRRHRRVRGDVARSHR